MNTWHWVVVSLACLAAIGCRTDPRIATLEQELRLHEDQIYQLQDCLEDANTSLESCREENERLRQGEGDAPVRRETSPKAISVEEPPAPVAPTRPSPPSRQEIPNLPGTLDIQVPTPDKFKREVPDALKKSTAPGSPELPELPEPPKNLPNPSRAKESDGEAPPYVPGADQGARIDTSHIDPATAQIASIQLDDLLTGSFDTDGQPGDEGLSVLIHPQDDQGRVVNVPAPISVVVIDPALPGKAARVARWEFTAEQVAASFRRTGSADGYHLELHWPDGAPLHDDLRLFVRYHTADGRKLHAQQPIEVAVTPNSSAGNTVRAAPTWRRKDVTEPPPSPGAEVSSSQLEAPSPPPPPPSPSPLARKPNRPVWSPERQ